VTYNPDARSSSVETAKAKAIMSITEFLQSMNTDEEGDKCKDDVEIENDEPDSGSLE
jgi:hypothetical protein